MTPEPTKKTGSALTPCLSLPQSSQLQADGSSVLGVQSFKGADRGTDHWLVVANVRERWAVIKQDAQKLYGERFNVRKLNELGVWKQYQIEITEIFAALENLKLADISGKKKGYPKAKFEDLETNSKIKNIWDLYRGISDFKKGYQPRCNIVKEEKCDLVADCHSISARWRKYFSQLLDVQEVNEVRQMEIHTAEPLVPEPSAFEVELATEKIKSHKSQVLIRSWQNWLNQGG